VQLCAKVLIFHIAVFPKEEICALNGPDHWM
jgi:hypothetical protein